MKIDNDKHFEKYKEELSQLYETYVDEFVAKHKKYGEEDCLDAYGEAILSIYESLKSGKTRKGNSFVIKKDLKSLLFVSAKRRLLTLLQRNSGIKKLEGDYIQELELELETEENHGLVLKESPVTPAIESIKNALNNLGGNCQEAITVILHRRL